MRCAQSCAPEAASYLTVKKADSQLLVVQDSPVTKTALRAYLAGGTLNETRVRETIGLALAASDFQWY